MQDQFLLRAIPARSHVHSSIPHQQTAPRQPQSWRKPAPRGLTQAQLQQIVLEQLG